MIRDNLKVNPDAPSIHIPEAASLSPPPATVDALRAQARHLQRHTEIVSHPRVSIPRHLEVNGYELVAPVIRPPRSAGQAYIAHSGEHVVVAFRGSLSHTALGTGVNVLRDLLAVKRSPDRFPPEFYDHDVRIHLGFFHEWRRFREPILAELRPLLRRAPVHVTGFSLGAALATLCAWELAMEEPEASISSLVFGGPRVGNHAFRDHMRCLLPDALRVCLDQEPVPKLSPVLPRRGDVAFAHAGGLLQLDESGQRIPDHAICGRLRDGSDFRHHVRDLYRDALDRYQPTETGGDWDRFERAALAELASLRSLRTRKRVRSRDTLEHTRHMASGRTQ